MTSCVKAKDCCTRACRAELRRKTTGCRALWGWGLGQTLWTGGDFLSLRSAWQQHVLCQSRTSRCACKDTGDEATLSTIRALKEENCLVATDAGSVAGRCRGKTARLTWT
eukprot:3514111-Rhodomonas_salina.2